MKFPTNIKNVIINGEKYDAKDMTLDVEFENPTEYDWMPEKSFFDDLEPYKEYNFFIENKNDETFFWTEEI